MKRLPKMGLPQSLILAYVLIMPIFNHMANPPLLGTLDLLPYRTRGCNF